MHSPPSSLPWGSPVPLLPAEMCDMQDILPEE